MSGKKKGSCLGAFFKIILIFIILGGILFGLIYSAIISPTGFAGRAAETILSPFASKELKESMDSTEEFLDEYIELAKTIDSNSTPEMTAELSVYLDKYQQAMNDLNKIDTDSLNWFSQMYANLRLNRMTREAADAALAYAQ